VSHLVEGGTRCEYIVHHGNVASPKVGQGGLRHVKGVDDLGASGFGVQAHQALGVAGALQHIVAGRATQAPAQLLGEQPRLVVAAFA